MRLYRLEDSGEPIADLQSRLSALGHSCHVDPPGVFGPSTYQALKAFQASRGLAPDGVLGPQTWGELVEAGYRMGDRLLYLTRPMLRGDDVADLQRRLGALGFRIDKIDGIFGPDTAAALADFQRNRGMAEDGMAGPEVFGELRLMARATAKAGREALAEQERLRNLPSSPVGRRVMLDPSCRDDREAALTWEAAVAAAARLREAGALPLLSRPADTNLPEHVRARRANRLGSELVIGFRAPSSEDRGVFFFASALGGSAAGALLAKQISSRLDLPIAASASTILKETRAPAALVTSDQMGSRVGLLTAEGVESFLRPAQKNDR